LQWLCEHWCVLALVAVAVAAGVLTWMAAQHVLAEVDVSQFAKLAADGFFGFPAVAKADADKALNDVLRGLRALEGLEKGGLAHVDHISKGFASADFARLVEGAVKAKLEAEATGLIKAARVGETTRGAVGQDDLDRFAANAATTVEAALGLVYRTVHGKWRAVARVDVTGRENYVHVLEKSPRGLKVLKRDVVHYLRYEVGDVAHGGARAEGVVVLVFLGGEKTIRVEVLAKSVAGLPTRFEEVEWGRGRWLRLATATIHKPSSADKYVVQIEPKPKLETEASNNSPVGVDGLRGLLVTDVSGKWIKTPDPLFLKAFASHFRRARIETVGVTHTGAGPALVFKAVALDDKPFEKLFGDIAEKYGVKRKEVVKRAKGMWLEVLRKLSAGIVQVADKAAEVGRGEGVEAGRRALVEGLKRLFEEREQEALSAGRSEEALAIAVAGRLLLGIVNSPREWLSLLVGDGAVDVIHRALGFTAKFAEVAKVILHLLAVWAGAYGAGIRTEERVAVFANSEDAARVLKAILTDDVLERAKSLAMSWNGLAGADAPKIISLLALAQLLGVVEGKWAVELWLAHKAATTPMPPEAAEVLDKLFARVEGVEKVKWTEGGVNIYFKVRGLEDASRAVTLRLYADFRHFLFYCDSCSETSAERVLRTLAEELRPAVEQLRRRLGLAAEGREWPRWRWNALALPADMGWPVFLRLWHKYNMSLPVEEGGRELLRIEVLEARPDGSAKFRLWYYKWREARPDQPYVDLEIKPSQRISGKIAFIGYVYANAIKGIHREHLVEIAELLKRDDAEGVTVVKGGKKLQFTGAFRDSVLSRLGITPELPRGEPAVVEHLGGYRFKVGNREVEFGVRVFGKAREFYAVLKLSSNEEAVRYAASLKAVGVDARVAGDKVRLDSDSFFGLLAATSAAPPDLTPLYSSDDLHVYARVEGGRMRFYFAVKHKGVWRVAGGVYNERTGNIFLSHAEHEVLESIGKEVAKTLERLGRPAEVGEPREMRDREGNVRVRYLLLYGHHIKQLLEHAAGSVKAKPAEVTLESRRIVVKASGIEVAMEYRLLKSSEAEYLLAQDVAQTLVLYKSLKALGVPVEITPRGVKVDAEAMWAMVATVVERAVESGGLKLVQESDGRIKSVEIVPNVELLNIYNAGDLKMYAFRVEGVHYYFAVKTGQGWRTAGGKHARWQVQIRGEAAETVAKAINAIYCERGAERRVEMKRDKNGAPYIQLTNVDLELLGIR